MRKYGWRLTMSSREKQEKGGRELRQVTVKLERECRARDHERNNEVQMRQARGV